MLRPPLASSRDEIFRCQNSTNAFCYWDSYSENQHCNGGFDCAENSGDCKEEINYCGDCKDWCYQCILDFGAASCTPLEQCLEQCEASPDCNRDREVCEDCKEGCLPPETDPCEYTEGDGSTCSAPCAYQDGTRNYKRMYWGEITPDEIVTIGAEQCRVTDSCTSERTEVQNGTQTVVVTQEDAVNCVLTETADFGVTAGSCADVDSSVATCTYVPGAASCAEGSGCHTILQLALDGYDLDYLYDVLRQQQEVAEAIEELTDTCPDEIAICIASDACSGTLQRCSFLSLRCPVCPSVCHSVCLSVCNSSM
eukprot:COSAG06_NODE_588_length_13995_cov_37.217401_14_plen_310_part_00